MIRYLLLVLFIVLIVWATRLLRQRERSRRPRPREDGRPHAAADDDRVMLACVLCGLHLPRNEALPGRGGVYCCEEHRAIVEARRDDAG